MSDILQIQTLNLLREIYNFDDKISLKTENLKGLKYAFYLEYEGNIEKEFYSSNSEFTFDVPFKEGSYKATFFYQFDKEKVSYSEFFFIDNLGIVKLINPMKKLEIETPVKLLDNQYQFVKSHNIKNINFLSIENICHSLFTNNSNFFESLLSNNNIQGCKPVFSHYKNWNNYILFEGYENFWMVQRITLTFAIFFPDRNLIVHRGPKNEKLLSAIEDITSFKTDIVKLNNPNFCLLNGYPRPFHYYYDTLQTFKYTNLDNFSEIIDINEFAFLPSDIFISNVKSENIALKDINSYLSSHNLIGFNTGALYGLNNLEFIKDFSEVIISSTTNKYLTSFNLEDKKLIIWIGICQESRKWIEQEIALIKLVKEIKNYNNDAFFIFDGLTCPHHIDKEIFRSQKCEKDLRLLNSIIDQSGISENDFLSVIGAKSVDKINLAREIDFFISDALTDSIWPATFGNKPGVSYAIERVKIVQFHPKTCFIPNQNVKEVGSGEGNSARVDFSINPDFFVDFVIDKLIKV